jgi:hypothetical protein
VLGTALLAVYGGANPARDKPRAAGESWRAFSSVAFRQEAYEVPAHKGEQDGEWDEAHHPDNLIPELLHGFPTVLSGSG